MKKMFLFIFLTCYTNAEIREYCPDQDSNAVLLIIESAFDALRDGPLHSNAQDVMDEYFNIPGSTTFVYEESGFICGFINVLKQNPLLLQKNKEERIGLICLLALAPEYRNKGLGGELVKSSLDWFEKNDVQRVSLYVHKDNDAAQRFYIKMGFVLLSNQNDPLIQGFKDNPCSDTDDILVLDL